MSESTFNTLAKSYDTEFSFTPVGRAQRSRVHDYIWPVVSGPKLKVLEINCGTGEDAIWLAKQGHSVTATDVSEEMVKTTLHKSRGVGVGHNVEPVTCGFSLIRQKFAGEKFDLILSNFGGLNCISGEDLVIFSADLATLLVPGGKFVAVIMPRATAWERLYFLLRLKPGKAFRRMKKGPVQAPLQDGSFQETWYFRPGEFARKFQKEFQIEKKYPVGICIPPSYLNTIAENRPSFFKRLVRWENFWAKPWLSNWGDHCYLQFRRK